MHPAASRTRRRLGPDRRLGSPGPRTPRATSTQFLQLLLASFGRSTRGPQTRRQDADRTQAGRATGASRTSSPSPPARAGQDRRAVSAHGLRPLPSSLARRAWAWRPRADLASGRRTPRAGGRHHRAPRTRAHLPRLWLPQSWRDPPGDPRSCHRAALGRGDVLLQRPSSHRPTRRGRGRRDRLRGADLPGLRLRARSGDECRLGRVRIKRPRRRSVTPR